eukprot:gene27855-34412_t
MSSRPSTENCPDYDNYRYGLTGLSEQLPGYKYLEPFAKRDKLEQAIDDFAQKDVRFVLGLEDVCNCGTFEYENPDACLEHSCRDYESTTNTTQPILLNRFATMESDDEDFFQVERQCCDSYPGADLNFLSKNCESNLQGYNRLQRGLNYINYLRDFYKKRSGITLTYKVELFDGAHDPMAFLSSSAINKWLSTGLSSS